MIGSSNLLQIFGQELMPYFLAAGFAVEGTRVLLGSELPRNFIRLRDWTDIPVVHGASICGNSFDILKYSRTALFVVIVDDD